MAEHEARLVLEVGLSEALARRLARLFGDAPHDAKEEAMLLDEAWGEIHAAYEHGAARLYRFARPTQPVVFVGVEGGLADHTAFGPVRVALVDWDAIRDAYDDVEALERIRECREEIAALPEGDFKAGLVAALDELERRHRPLTERVTRPEVPAHDAATLVSSLEASGFRALVMWERRTSLDHPPIGISLTQAEKPR